MRSTPLLTLASLLLGACGASDAAGPRNAILICIDTLRADRLGCYGYEARTTTPNLDALAARSTVFRDVCAPAGWTKPSVPSYLTGTYPLQHGVYECSARGIGGTTSDVLPDEATTLAETFRTAGYRTAAFVRNAQLRPGLGFEQGFDLYQDEAGDAREIRWQALDWLDDIEAGEPFFLYLHLLDVHMPYDVPDEWASRFAPLADVAPFREDGWRELRDAVNDGERVLSGAEREALGAVYDGSLAFVDHELGALLEGLELRGRSDDTVICLVSDHGEELGERGRMGHGHGLTELLLRVPFVLHVPGAPGRVIDQPVDLVDVHPTLLSAAGLFSEGALPATDRWRTPEAPALLFAEHRTKNRYSQSLRQGDEKLVRTYRPELEADPDALPARLGERWEAELAFDSTGALRATRLKPREEPADEPVELKGVLGGEPGALTVAGLTVELAANLRVEDPDATGLALAPGVHVKLRGEFADGRFVAERAKLYPADREVEVEVRGPVTLADGIGAALAIGGIALHLAPDTVWEADADVRRPVNLEDVRAIAAGGPEGGETRLFDLGADPLELRGALEEAEHIQRRLDGLDAALLESALSGGGARVLGEAELEALRQIGYAQ
jgi:arylsulfatase A-like enzyme